MRAPSRDVRYGAFGVVAGLAAVAAGRCGGGSCLSCLACAVPGALVLLAALGAHPRAAGEGGHHSDARQSSQTSMK